MTATQSINSLAIGIPFAIAVFAIFDTVAFVFALLSTMVTGVLQITIGLSLLKNHYKNIYLQIYLFVCALFFSLWYFTSWDWIWALPVVLVIYMTIIVHFIIIEE